MYPKPYNHVPNLLILEFLMANAGRIPWSILDSAPFATVRNRDNTQRYLFTVVLMGLALLVRLSMWPVSAGLQYVTFFPAVTLAAIAGGYRAGLLATAIGVILATCIFTPPYYSFSIEVLHASLWSNIVFLADGIIVSLSIEAMHIFRHRSQQELKESRESEANLMRLNEELEKQIAERKRAEAALQLYRTVVDITRDGFWMCDTSGYLLKVNQAYIDKSGYTREELVGMHVSQISELADTPAKVRALIEKIVAEGLTHFETRHRRKDGAVIHFEGSNTYLAESKVICCFLRDISEQKQMEDILRASENRYRTLIENSPLCIHEIDMDGRIASMNQAGLLMIGVEEENAVRGFPYLDTVSTGDRERIGNLLTMAYAGETSHFEFKSSGPRAQFFKSCFVPIINTEGRVERLMGIKEDITARRAAAEQIHSLAFYDSLTHLPNRRLLDDRLEQAMANSKRRGRHGALMFLDLDNFKPLNDMHGHNAGDLLLAEAARRIVGCVREADTIARFGGDEFVVVLSELDVNRAKSASQAEIIAEKVRTALSQPYLLTPAPEAGADSIIEHHCTVSIGVALFVDQEVSHDDILKWADMAMYQAKEEGRNLIRFHDSEASMAVRQPAGKATLLTPVEDRPS